MKKLGLNEIREKYLSFFEGKEHLRHPSFSLMPQGDNSLLLINSGMAPLKPYFSGEAVPPSKRMTTCQKCIRTPDIERVGKTARHGTFFEMLGNFSFGDYFKREACAWAWEFVTEVMEIPRDRLHISVYLDDDEAWDIWTKEIGVDASHMTRLGKADNFWEIGAGPCGPCSEIYFDRGAESGCGSPECAVGCDCDRYVEFWNLVFTQFNNDGQNNYTPLIQKNIDTGMGLERLACIMQGVNSLFDVDTVRNITNHVSHISGVKYGDNSARDVSLRIITDHIRGSVMLVSDGILPSNEGRGYILRRLLRRAARHGKLIGISRPFLCEVCETVIEESGGAYPELIRKRDFIRRVIKMEEERFEQTIDAGLKIINELIERAEAENIKIFPGDEAFKLYDTYGFPVDLTRELLEERGLELVYERFTALMNEQRERARAARTAMDGTGWGGIDLGLPRGQETEFTGYESFKENARVLSIIAEGELKAAATAGDEVTIVLDKTPFYAESGGQTADTGTIEASGGSVEINDVRKSGDGKYMHIGKVTRGQIAVDDTSAAAIDVERRRAVMRAHSATHLLQKALRNNVGAHVEQAGSLVEPDRLRFDFTHFAALSSEELMNVEREVNREILEGLSVEVSQMGIDDAKKLGAMALFGEKYGDVVRVVRMGDYSAELCGGTHLDNTAKAGIFKITSESSIASGVRRIEAVTGLLVHDYMDLNAKTISEAAGILKTAPKELAAKLTQLLEESKEMRRELDKIKSQAASGEAAGYLDSAIDIKGIKLISRSISGADAEALKRIGDTLTDKEPGVAALLAAVTDDKITFLAVCGKEAVARGIKAGELIRESSKIAGGSGGGKPDYAMGGGKDVSKLGDALDFAKVFVEGKA